MTLRIFFLVLMVMGSFYEGHAVESPIQIEKIYSRATMGPNGAVFMTLKNTTDNNIALTAAETDIAAKVELHTHVEENGVMKMRPVHDMPVPANAQLTLEPGALHVMLLGIKNPLKEHDEFSLRLRFDNGLVLRVVVPVKTAGYKGCGCSK